MKIVIIGNSVGGQTAAETILRKTKGKDIEITMISRESYPYYSRIYLPHYIAEERTKNKLFIRDLDWYEKNGIHLLLGVQVKQIDRDNKRIIFEDSDLKIKYDKLIIASGSRPRKLPFGNPNPDLKGVFTLRTIQDADEIKSYIEKNAVEKAFIIGGGLLGIELGYHLKDLNMEVTICEIANYLLPRQLCADSAQYLEEYLEENGLKFVIGKTVKKIIGNELVTAVEMESGEIIKTQMIMQQLGIIPNLEIAKSSNLKVERGICVNEYMQTDDVNVYAVGDCIQFNNQIWGIIPATMEQAKLAASHILHEEPEPYTPSLWQTKLKIAGLDLMSVGTPNPINKDVAEVIWKIDKESHTCRKVIYEGNKMTGAILMGPGADTRFFIQNLGKDIDVEEIKKKVSENKSKRIKLKVS